MPRYSGAFFLAALADYELATKILLLAKYCSRTVRTGLSVQELAPKSESRASKAHLAGCTILLMLKTSLIREVFV